MSFPSSGGDDVKTRLVLLTAELYRGKAITVLHIRDRFKVSTATAKRDMTVLEQLLPVNKRRADDSGYHEMRLTP